MAPAHTAMLTQEPMLRPSFPVSRKRDGTVPTIRPMNSQVVTVLDTSMAAAMPLAKPRKPMAHPSPMGRNHRQYLGMASRGWVEHHRQHPAGNPRQDGAGPDQDAAQQVPQPAYAKIPIPLPPQRRSSILLGLVDFMIAVLPSSCNPILPLLLKKFPVSTAPDAALWKLTEPHVFCLDFYAGFPVDFSGVIR